MRYEQTNPAPANIAPATADDLRQLVDLEEAVSLQIYPSEALAIAQEDIAAIGWGDERVAKYTERFLDNQDANIWAAKVNGEAVGFTAASIEGGEQWVKKLYVASDQQNRGIGGALLRKAEIWLGDRPIRAGVAAHLPAALKFYTARGYTVIGPRPHAETTLPATGLVISERLLIRYPTIPRRTQPARSGHPDLR